MLSVYLNQVVGNILPYMLSTTDKHKTCYHDAKLSPSSSFILAELALISRFAPPANQPADHQATRRSIKIAIFAKYHSW